MKPSRWLALAALAALPAAIILPTVTAQTPPQNQAAPQPSIDPELPIELKKAQIQADLAEKIAKVKADEARDHRAKGTQGVASQLEIYEDDLEALMARLNADVAKINVDSLDLQSKTPQYPPLPGYAPPPNPIAKTLMDFEVKKAQLQSSAADQVVNIRQAQFDAADAAFKAGQLEATKRNDAYLNLETAKANAEISRLDLGIIQARAATVSNGSPTPAKH